MIQWLCNVFRGIWTLWKCATHHTHIYAGRLHMKHTHTHGTGVYPYAHEVWYHFLVDVFIHQHVYECAIAFSCSCVHMLELNS